MWTLEKHEPGPTAWRWCGRITGPGAVPALVSGLSITDAPPEPSPGAQAVVVGCAASADADDPAEASLASWGPRGRAAMDAGLAAWIERARVGGWELWLRPDARGLVSDAPTVLGLLRRHAGSPLRLFLEPAALLTPSMIPRAEDHLRRVCEALAGHEATAAVLVTNLEGEPAERGPIPGELLALVERAARAAGKPVVRLPREG